MKRNTKKMMKKIVSILVILATSFPVSAQPVTYESFCRLVAVKNALYLAEKFNIDIAEASLHASKVFNDPELSIAYGNNQDWNIQMGQALEVGLGINPDLAGVRKARIAVACNEKEITEASVAAYLSNLRFEAACAWADAWELGEKCSILEQSVEDMMQIARSDSLRFEVGDISRADALQSSLEAQAMMGSLITLRSEYLNALNTLSLFAGGESVGAVEGGLPELSFELSEGDVCALAEANRADLKAAMLSKTLSENNLKLVLASRAFEMGVDLGYSYNKEVRNEIAPAPRFNGLTVGVSIPLKFSNANKAEVNAARSRILQSERYFEAARLQVRSEAAQAFNSLQASLAVREQYTGSILDDARAIMLGRKEGYLKGESSLLELLSAQQTYLEVMSAYVGACRECFVCRAELEKAVGCNLHMQQ